MTIQDQIAKFEKSLTERLAIAQEEARSSLGKIKGFDNDVIVEDGISRAQYALDVKRICKLYNNIANDPSLAPVLDIFQSASDLGIKDLERDNPKDANSIWMRGALTPEMRERILHWHYQTQNGDLDELHEEIVYASPPAISLLLQAVWAPMHARVAA